MDKFEQKDGTATLFKNDKQAENPAQPMYRGKGLVDGKEKEFAIWVKEGKRGKYFSMTIKDAYVKPDGINNIKAEDIVKHVNSFEQSDDLPF